MYFPSIHAVFVQKEYASTARTVIIDCFNDKCANFRRKKITQNFTQNFNIFSFFSVHYLSFLVFRLFPHLLSSIQKHRSLLVLCGCVKICKQRSSYCFIVILFIFAFSFKPPAPTNPSPTSASCSTTALVAPGNPFIKPMQASSLEESCGIWKRVLTLLVL